METTYFLKTKQSGFRITQVLVFFKKKKKKNQPDIFYLLRKET